MEKRTRVITLECRTNGGDLYLPEREGVVYIFSLQWGVGWGGGRLGGGGSKEMVSLLQGGRRGGK